MRTRFEPMRPWTRSHEKFAEAWGRLASSEPRLEMGAAKLERWIYVRWGVHRIRELTVAQARAGCRQLNAWRASAEGRAVEYRVHARQMRRNYRRRLLRTLSPCDGDFAAYLREIDRRVTSAFGSRTAGKTAITAPEKFENLISGTALAGLGRLIASESDR